MGRRKKRDDPRRAVAEYLRAEIAKNTLKSADAMKAADWIAAWEEAEAAKEGQTPDAALLDMDSLTDAELDDLLLRLESARTLKEIIRPNGTRRGNAHGPDG